MKNIIKQFGGVIVSCLVAILIINSFWGVEQKGISGIPKIIGNLVTNKLDAYMNRNNNSDAFRDYQTRSGIKILYNSEIEIMAGEGVFVDQLFTTTEGDKVEVVKVEKADDNQLMKDVISGNELIFPEAGVYRLYLKAGLNTKDQYYANASIVVNCPEL